METCGKISIGGADHMSQGPTQKEQGVFEKQQKGRCRG